MKALNPELHRTTLVFDTGPTTGASSVPVSSDTVAKNSELEKGSNDKDVNNDTGKKNAIIAAITSFVHSYFSLRSLNRSSIGLFDEPDPKLVREEMVRWMRENLRPIVENTVDCAIQELKKSDSLAAENLRIVLESVDSICNKITAQATKILVQKRMEMLCLTDRSEMVYGAANILLNNPKDEEIDQAVEGAFEPVFTKYADPEASTESDAEVNNDTSFLD